MIKMRDLLKESKFKQNDVVYFKKTEGMPIVRAQNGEKLQAVVFEIDGENIGIDNVQFLSERGNRESPQQIYKMRRQKLNRGPFYINTDEIIGHIPMNG